MRLELLNELLNNIDRLKDDPDNTYRLVRTYDDAHHVKKNSKGIIEISYSSWALAAHEVTHIIQFLIPNVPFNFIGDNYLTYRRPPDCKDMTICEVEAYQIQYAMDSRSLPINVNSIDMINFEYIYQLYNAGYTNYLFGKITYEYEKERQKLLSH